MRVLNDPRPWWGMLHGPVFSLRQLVQNGTLNQETAELLQFGVEHGASLFVAAGPQGAGKSTLATALLEFLPEQARVYVTSGPWDPIEVMPAEGPLYLLINELSWHMPLYLHGPAAQRAFELLREGARMVGTVHARSVAEAVDAICAEAQVERAQLCAPMLVAIITPSWTQHGSVERRVSEVALLDPVPGASPGVVQLATGAPLQINHEASEVLKHVLLATRQTNNQVGLT